MKNNLLSNNIDYNEVDTLKKYRHIPQNFKANTVNINKLLNRVKINEKNKQKENLIYLSVAILFVSITALFLII